MLAPRLAMTAVRRGAAAVAARRLAARPAQGFEASASVLGRRAAGSEPFDAAKRLAESRALLGSEGDTADPEQAQEQALLLYDDWAASYDRTMVEDWGYTLPQQFVEMCLSKGLSPDGEVLDFGCGTGLIGDELAKHGFKRIHGCDISKESLGYADMEGVYTTLKVVDMNMQPFPYEDSAFEIVTSAGNLNYAQNVYAVLSEYTRVARSMVAFTYSFNVNETQDWEEALVAKDRLEKEGRWIQVYASEALKYGNDDSEIGLGRRFRMFIMQVQQS